MARIRHLAITTDDPEKVAAFYVQAFGMEEISCSPTGSRHLTDGYIDLAILNWKTEKDPDVGPNGPNYSGIHHIGFVVDDVMTCADHMEKAGATLLTSLDPAERRGSSRGAQAPRNAEAKLSGPDGIIIDISEFGWVGNSL